jgi:DNA-binding IclR family transcriptional regulator
MSCFDFVLDTLADSKYHTFEDIFSRQTKLNENQLEYVLAFLDRYGFIRRLRKTWSMRTRMVKLQPEMTNFLNRLKELETCK